MYEYKKEMVQSTKEMVSACEIQINNLLPTIVLHGDIEIKVKHTLIFSMIDGKVIK